MRQFGPAAATATRTTQHSTAAEAIIMRFRRAAIVTGGAVLLVLYGVLIAGPLAGGCGVVAAQKLPLSLRTPRSRRSLTDNLHSGIKLASSIFGLDATTSDVANLVAKAFAKPPAASNDGQRRVASATAASDSPQRQLTDMAPPGVLSHLLRMFGLDGSQIGAMAVNGIIMIAQMIGKTLSDNTAGNIGRSASDDTNHQSARASGSSADRHKVDENPTATNTDRTDTDENQEEGDESAADDDNIANESPFDWIVDSKSAMMQGALQAIRDRDLPKRLIAGIGALEGRADEAGCIKLLLCKCAPFVWGMQRSIAERLDGGGGVEPTAAENGTADQAEEPKKPSSFTARLDGFFRHLPGVGEFRENGAECEREHSACFAEAK